MNHFIDHIVIQNFKSIRHLDISDFRRINLLIGRPNVGKSNILEALSLFSLPYMWDGSKLLTDILRLESPREIFYDGNISEQIAVGLKQENKSQEEYHIIFSRETGGLSFSIRERKDPNKNYYTKSRHAFIDTKFRVKKILRKNRF